MPEWKSLGGRERPKLDRPFHIKYGSNAEPSSCILRVHQELYELAHLQRQDGSEWIDVGLVNEAWIVRNCEWRYVTNTTATTESSSHSPKDGDTQ